MQSGALIKIDNADLPAGPEHPPGTGTCNAITVSGTEEQVQAAVAMINELLASSPADTLYQGSLEGAARGSAPIPPPMVSMPPPTAQLSVSATPALLPFPAAADAWSRAGVVGSNLPVSLPAPLPAPLPALLPVPLPAPLPASMVPTAVAPPPPSAATPRELKYLIAKDDAKRLIGPGGTNIKRLREQSGALIKIENVDLPPAPEHPPGTGPCNNVTVVGTEPEVQAALQMIATLLSASPADTLYNARGPAAASSQPAQMQQAQMQHAQMQHAQMMHAQLVQAQLMQAQLPMPSNPALSMPLHPSPSSYLVPAPGLVASVPAVLPTPMTPLAAAPTSASAASPGVSSSTPRELKYSIPKDDAKRLIGPGGANIKRLRMQSGALIKIDNADLPAGPEHPPGTGVCNAIAIVGTEPQVQAALQLISELLATSPSETLRLNT